LKEKNIRISLNSAEAPKIVQMEDFIDECKNNLARDS